MTKNKLTEGPIIKSLLILSVPIIFANILQTAYQLIDTFWVGRLGANAVAAVSLSFPIIFLLISSGGGLAIAGTILVSQYRGKNDKKSVDHIAAQTLLTMFFISLVLSIIGYTISPFVIKLMGVEADVFADTVSYLRISFLGTVFLFSYFVFQSLMRGVGDVKTPLYIVLCTVLLNLILDPFFIFGYGIMPALGVAGAAVSTIVTQGLAAVVGIMMLFSGKYDIHIRKSNLKLDIKLILKMFKLGLPASIEHSTRALGMLVMTFIVASFGTEVIASYGIGTRILSFIIIPALGLSMATSTLVGQNIGAKKIERAVRITKLSGVFGFVVLTLAGIILFIFAKQISAFFIPGDIIVINMSALFIKIMSLTFGFIGIQQVLNGAFRGSGNTFISMILAIISLWVLRFPLAYILAYHTKLAETGIWLSFPIANVIAAIITLIWFANGSWKKKKITEEFKLSEKISKETLIEEGLQ